MLREFFGETMLQCGESCVGRKLHVADGLEPAGGEGVAAGDVPGDTGGAAARQGGGAVRPCRQDEAVQAPRE